MTPGEPSHILIHHFLPGRGPQAGTPEHDEEMRQWEAIHQELSDRGTLVAGFAYELEGATLADGQVHPVAITDLESGEVSFAVHVIAVADDQAAADVARGMPTANYGRVEIRRIM